ncbi:MAG: hypothetical protein H6962_00505 [Chromatiaceae bacterium]|nr:hypothetical protein [Chromatiaceae bacterium]
MRLLRDAPIKRKLYAIIMGTTTAVLLLSLVLSLVLQIGAARDATSSHLHALAAVFASNSRATVAFRDRDEAAGVLAALATQGDVLSAAIVLPDGSVFASYQSPRSRTSPKQVRWRIRFSIGLRWSRRSCSTAPRSAIYTSSVT